MAADFLKIQNVFFSDTVILSNYNTKSKQSVLQNVQHLLVPMLLKYLNAQQGLLLQAEKKMTKSKWDVQNRVQSCDEVISQISYLSSI